MSCGPRKFEVKSTHGRVLVMSLLKMSFLLPVKPDSFNEVGAYLDLKFEFLGQDP